MADPSTYIASTWRPQQVSVKAAWEDEWTPVGHLWADVLTSVAAPSISSAELTWRYGIGSRQGESAPARVEPQSLIGQLVRVEVSGLDPWVGVIIEEIDNRDGAVERVESDEESENDAQVRVASGEQRFIAYGLEFLLERVPITQSVVAGDPDDVRINRVIAFNAADGSGDQSSVNAGNASLAAGSAGTRVFAAELNGASSTSWKGGWIIAYLFEHFGPRDKSGNVLLPFVLETGGAASALNYDVPTLDPRGKTLKQVIDELVPRRRGLSWYLSLNSDGDVQLKLFTFTSQTLNLSDSTVPANPNLHVIDVDLSIDVERIEIRNSAAERYDQVLVRGARRGSVLTLSNLDGTWDGDWSSPQEAKYEAAATTAPDYGTWSASEKLAHHDDVRASDALERVWSWYVLMYDWDGLVGDGIGGTPKELAFPELDADGLPTSQGSTFWRPGLRLEPRLPLRVASDYSGTRIADDTVTHADPDAAQPEFLKPFVLLPSTSGEWQLAERLDAAVNANDPNRPQSWACNVELRSDDAGLILSIVNGPQHYLGAADFDFNADDDEDTFLEQAIDWRDMIATVYMLQDDHVEAKYPADEDLPAGQLIRRVQIDIPDAHLDWVPAGTVVGVTYGTPDRVTTGAFVRDDRMRLQDIAKTAWEWYGKPRKKVSIELKGLYPGAKVGTLITTIGSGATRIADVNAVVTSVRHDLVQNTTTLDTDFGNIDQELFA